MARRRNDNGSNGPQEQLVSAITVKGFKSIAQRRRMDIRPLTILAGANSSGKSSMMQPALLIKQTLESSYDPGPLKIDGPNVKFTEFDQLFWATGAEKPQGALEIGFESSDGERFRSEFRRSAAGVDIDKQVFTHNAEDYTLRPHQLDHDLLALARRVGVPSAQLLVIPDRCFLYATDGGSPPCHYVTPRMPEDFVRRLIHVPGLRPRSADRQFPKAAVGDAYPGTFDDYFASALNHWKRRMAPELDRVSQDLEDLGLTWKVDVEEVGDLALTIKVGRLPHPARSSSKDMVNMADVGFGVSQVLPFVVALHAAKLGDAVYIEQPELHLHPRAQVRMATILANAAKRGVRVIAETHSSLLLRGIQTLVAGRKLRPKEVALHWFERNKIGATEVTMATLCEDGSFGDWPADFDEVAVTSARDYLDAADARSGS